MYLFVADPGKAPLVEFTRAENHINANEVSFMLAKCLKACKNHPNNE